MIRLSNYKNKLRIAKWRFKLSFSEGANLPPIIGNTLRGALGKSLCDNFAEAYNEVFKVSGNSSVPNPFVISAPYPGKEIYLSNESLEFAITLFGTACKYEDEIIKAANLMSEGKLSGANLTDMTCEYSGEWTDEGMETFPTYGDILLRFITPTELIRNKAPDYEPDFGTYIDSLFSRISMIMDLYGESEFVIPYSLFANKPYVKAEYNLKRVSINSNNQPINGFTGNIAYRGDITPYLPYIFLGSQIHIGKKTTRSCGEYIFELEGFQ
jgi:hypothetical protein